jgi:hypothetical protein
MAGTLVKLDGKKVNSGKGVKVGMTLVTGKPGRFDLKPGVPWLTAIFLLTGNPEMSCTPTSFVRAAETVFVTAAGIGSTLLANGPKPSLIPRAGLGRLSKRPAGIATGIACSFLSCELADC